MQKNKNIRTDLSCCFFQYFHKLLMFVCNDIQTLYHWDLRNQLRLFFHPTSLKKKICKQWCDQGAGIHSTPNQRQVRFLIQVKMSFYIGRKNIVGCDLAVFLKPCSNFFNMPLCPSSIGCLATSMLANLVLRHSMCPY